MSIDLVTSLLIFAHCKFEGYDSILIIVDYLTKIVYYGPVKIIIDIPD